jgi:hypothetical protein
VPFRVSGGFAKIKILPNPPLKKEGNKKIFIFMLSPLLKVEGG